ncbi:MAG: hypothetical protein IPL88_06850 [Rhizobiales bacterium]|nr:hypothetical protein [Hyphomicrobiales bacterium]
MTYGFKTLLAAAALGALAIGGSSGAFAQAAVMKECGAEWQTAKDTNATGGKTWNQFLAECRVRKAANTPAAAPAAPAPAPAAAAPKPAAPAPAAAAPKPAAPAAAAPKPAAPAVAGAVPAGVVLPKAVDAKYATLSPGKQRLQTCSDQWQANKATGGNGTMKWIEKGGGFWSLCNKRLKGEI